MRKSGLASRTPAILIGIFLIVSSFSMVTYTGTNACIENAEFVDHLNESLLTL